MRFSTTFYLGLLLAFLKFSDCSLLPVHSKKSLSEQRFELIHLKKAADTAIKRHKQNPARCSLFSTVNMLEADTEAIYKRSTGRETTDCEYQCSYCQTMFSNYLQGYLHDCSPRI